MGLLDFDTKMFDGSHIKNSTFFSLISFCLFSFKLKKKIKLKKIITSKAD